MYLVVLRNFYIWDRLALAGTGFVVDDRKFRQRSVGLADFGAGKLLPTYERSH
jgi:hypothetical protein